jgi:glycosyltransferase involved in cell wall biosynthesis
MRIILLVDRYLPSPLSSAKMIYDLATEFARLDHEVTVVTSDADLAADVDISRDRQVTVVRVRAGKIRHPSRIIRTINETRLSGLIWRRAGSYLRSHPCDLVVAYSPTIFWSRLISNLKALAGGRSYLVLRDLFPQWALDAGLLRRTGPAFWYFRWQELRLYRSADVIGVQSPANLDHFSNSGLRGRGRLEVLFNWTVTDELSVADAGWRARLGLQGRVIFMFGGNFGVAQDMDNLLRLASALKGDSDICLLLVGEGSEYARIEREIALRALDNVKLLPAVSHGDYLRMLAECDVGLVTLRRDLKTQNFPGKLLSYMQLRKPILASINPGNDLKDVVQTYDAGLVCENGDDQQFRQSALRLASDPDLRQRMGNNARRLLHDKFDVASAARQILSHFGGGASPRGWQIGQEPA